jgi:hypothetical protein
VTLLRQYPRLAKAAPSAPSRDDKASRHLVAMAHLGALYAPSSATDTSQPVVHANTVAQAMEPDLRKWADGEHIATLGAAELNYRLAATNKLMQAVIQMPEPLVKRPIIEAASKAVAALVYAGAMRYMHVIDRLVMAADILGSYVKCGLACPALVSVLLAHSMPSEPSPPRGATSRTFGSLAKEFSETADVCLLASQTGVSLGSHLSQLLTLGNAAFDASPRELSDDGFRASGRLLHATCNVLQTLQENSVHDLPPAVLGAFLKNAAMAIERVAGPALERMHGAGLSPMPANSTDMQVAQHLDRHPLLGAKAVEEWRLRSTVRLLSSLPVAAAAADLDVSALTAQSRALVYAAIEPYQALPGDVLQGARLRQSGRRLISIVERLHPLYLHGVTSGQLNAWRRWLKPHVGAAPGSGAAPGADDELMPEWCQRLVLRLVGGDMRQHGLLRWAVRDLDSEMLGDAGSNQSPEDVSVASPTGPLAATRSVPSRSTPEVAPAASPVPQASAALPSQSEGRHPSPPLPGKRASKSLVIEICAKLGLWLPQRGAVVSTLAAPLSYAWPRLRMGVQMHTAAQYISLTAEEQTAKLAAAAGVPWDAERPTAAAVLSLSVRDARRTLTGAELRHVPRLRSSALQAVGWDLCGIDSRRVTTQGTDAAQTASPEQRAADMQTLTELLTSSGVLPRVRAAQEDAAEATRQAAAEASLSNSPPPGASAQETWEARM